MDYLPYLIWTDLYLMMNDDDDDDNNNKALVHTYVQSFVGTWTWRLVCVMCLPAYSYVESRK